MGPSSKARRVSARRRVANPWRRGAAAAPSAPTFYCELLGDHVRDSSGAQSGELRFDTSPARSRSRSLRGRNARRRSRGPSPRLQANPRYRNPASLHELAILCRFAPGDGAGEEDPWRERQHRAHGPMKRTGSLPSMWRGVMTYVPSTVASHTDLVASELPSVKLMVAGKGGTPFAGPGEAFLAQPSCATPEMSRHRLEHTAARSTPYSRREKTRRPRMSKSRGICAATTSAKRSFTAARS